MNEEMVIASIRDFHKELTDFKTEQFAINSEILKELAIVKDRSHQPATCSLGKDVKTLQMKEAKQAGALVVVGFITATITTIIIGVILVFTRKILGNG